MMSSSSLECLSTEILQQICVLSGNPSLLTTSKAIQASLSCEIVYKRLVIHAFRRENCCEINDLFNQPDTYCQTCRLNTRRHIAKLWAESTSSDVPERLQFSAYDIYRPEYKSDIECIGSEFDDKIDVLDYPEKTKFKGKDGREEIWEENRCIHDPPCEMTISEKRRLQNQIIKAPWFSLNHVLAVEEQCTVCPDATHGAYKELSHDLPFDPLGGCDFELSPLTQFHRRHIVHGVGLPPRTLQGTPSKEDRVLLKKLMRWGVDDIWDWTACWKVRRTVMESVGDAIRDAIRQEDVELIELLAAHPHRQGCIGYPVRWDLLKFGLDSHSSINIIKVLINLLDGRGPNGVQDYYPGYCRDQSVSVIPYESSSAWQARTGGEGDETRRLRELLQDYFPRERFPKGWKDNWMHQVATESRKRDKVESAKLSEGFEVDPYQISFGLMSCMELEQMCRWNLCQTEGWDPELWTAPQCWAEPSDPLEDYKIEWFEIQKSQRVAVARARKKMVKKMAKMAIARQAELGKFEGE
jgi:hypothetical protein